MSDPTLIADLARAGLDPELLQRVADLQQRLVLAETERHAAQASELAIRQRRESDARRKRESRERQRTVTGQSQDSHVTSNEINGVASQPSRARKPFLLPLVEEQESKEVRKKDIARGCSLPADWKPNENHYLKYQQFGRAFIDQEAEAMREWALANAHRAVARKAGIKGWDLTFSGWLKRAAKPITSRGTNGTNSTTAVAMRIYHEELEREKRERDQRSMGVLLPFRGS